MQDSKRPQDQPGQDHSDLETAQTELDQETERAQLRKLNAAARLAEAKARAAEHQADQSEHWAAAEPDRQETTLWERKTRLRLEVAKVWMLFLVALIFLAIQVAGMIVNPWFFSLNLLIPLLGFIAKPLFGGGGEDRKP